MAEHRKRKQRIRDRIVDKACGENSPYQDFMEAHGFVYDITENIPEDFALWKLPKLDEESQLQLTAIKMAWHTLSPKQRNVLTLYTQNKGYDRIAKAMKISKRSVRVHINRAKEKIKEIYDGLPQES